ncbi:sulfotransferase family 2 domain-containing protein [Pontibaca salina]|uniref:Nodulation protein NodH n=1 Tax=Pontibaca salina TaxID=2795731 RepID=A0A934LYZ6_9RHOB|nr:sulfotransferase family 2 domain-containing protein [Pontibaca salina]MBI6628465.1 nodulation protein NodH [Pontibaca salina]
MADSYDYFILLAEMRTGSNFLEANLNTIDGLVCHGEAFNPYFIGYPNRSELFGMTQAMRDADPARLIAVISEQSEGLGGFRFFHDHDPRALELALGDPRCAKVILTRNPLDSYVSWKIAQATGQWKLTNLTRRRTAKAAFEPAEFTAYVNRLHRFQAQILNRLQVSGQTAFYLGYDDLHNVEVINGLAQWLGVSGRLDALDTRLKLQNPGSVIGKVSNPDVMTAALADIDWLDVKRIPTLEPRRSSAVRSYVAAAKTDLLYLPIGGGPRQEIVDWLAALDGVDPADLTTELHHKQLRMWKSSRPGHRSFTVLRHPVARAHAVFCRRILSTAPGSYTRIRAKLRRQFKLEIPRAGVDRDYTAATHRTAFQAFLRFLQSNLAGQTAIRVDAEWCSQAQALAGFGEVMPPDHILREEQLNDCLPALAQQLGHPAPPALQPPPADTPFTLAEIYDEAIENLVADIYQRDYQTFGFASWAES